MAETLISPKQLGDGVFTTDSLVAGTGISILEKTAPVIDEYTQELYHLNDDNGKNYINNTVTTLSTGSFVDGHFGKCYNKGSIAFQNEYTNSSSYTIDFWLYWVPRSSYDYSVYANFNANINAYTGVGFEFGPTNFTIQSPMSGTGSQVYQHSYPSGMSVSRDTWYHVAYVNDVENNEVRLFLDGKLIYSATKTSTLSTLIYIDTFTGSGKVDELRCSTIARWNSDFIPPTEPYSTSSSSTGTQYQIQSDVDTSQFLSNTATGSNSLTLQGTANTNASAINIGSSSVSNANGAALGISASGGNTGIAIGNYSSSGSSSVAIGAASSSSNKVQAGNNATAIGYNATASQYSIALGAYANTNSYSVAIGSSADSTNRANASYQGCVAIGSKANATNDGCIAIGDNPTASGSYSIAIGRQASATASRAIQIGQGTNSTANTFQVSSTTLLNANNKVPIATFDFTSITGYDASKTQVLKHVSGALQWVDEA